MKDTLVLYHKGCRDGFGAAWAVWRKFKDRAVYHPIRFDATKHDIPFEWLDPMSGGRRVYMLDVFPENRELVKELNDLHDLTVLDHHETSQGQAKGFEDLDHRYSEYESGAVMAWKHFHVEPVPMLLRYVQDRDLWEWALDSSEEINAFIRSWPMEFSEWTHLASIIKYDFKDARQSGEAILRHKQQAVEWIAGAATRETFQRDGEEYTCINVNARAYPSDVAHLLLDQNPDVDVALVWHLRDRNEVKISLRSRDDGPHVGKLAEAHGGGGHANAAGMTCSFDEFWI